MVKTETNGLTIIIVTIMKSEEIIAVEILNIELNLESLVKFIDFASIQRQVRILGKLSQVYEQLNRSERLKDFHKLINYLKNTSEKYSELENFSYSIAILKEPLKIKLEKIFS